MEAGAARERFVNSTWIRRLWPPGWREKSLPEFAIQDRLNRQFLGIQYYSMPEAPVGSSRSLVDLDALLTETTLETAVLWGTGTSAEEQRIAEALLSGGAEMPILDEILALGALSRRDYRAAEQGLARAEPHANHAVVIRQWRVLALGLAGDVDGAGRLLVEARALFLEPEPCSVELPPRALSTAGRPDSLISRIKDNGVPVGASGESHRCMC